MNRSEHQPKLDSEARNAYEKLGMILAGGVIALSAQVVEIADKSDNEVAQVVQNEEAVEKEIDSVQSSEFVPSSEDDDSISGESVVHQTPELSWMTPEVDQWLPIIDAVLDELKDDGHELIIDRNDVATLIYLESRGDANAESEAGAVGLTQLMPIALEQIKIDIGEELDPLNPWEAIRGGAYLLNRHAHTYGVENSVIAYHDGSLAQSTTTALNYAQEFDQLRNS